MSALTADGWCTQIGLTFCDLLNGVSQVVAKLHHTETSQVTADL